MEYNFPLKKRDDELIEKVFFKMTYYNDVIN